ncbi:MAG: NYN domain-containing protein [Betaproteobacteria bacterium]|nr:NYN domain-containing protein [Betaproteobacteria bacterium]
MAQETQSMALFCDFENVALGVRDAKYEKFDIKKVLERLLLKGSIVVKKAYCDWERYKGFKASMHEASFELIEIPHVRQSGKNSADIRMVVDALDLCYTKSHVDTFVLITGDSDFSPLVSKLRENNKTVIGVGVKKSTSDLLIANCDEFIYYDDLVREKPKRTTTSRGRAAPKSLPKEAAEPPSAAEVEVPVVAEAVEAPPPAVAESAGTKGRKAPSRGRRGAKAAKAEPAAAETTVAGATEAEAAEPAHGNGNGNGVEPGNAAEPFVKTEEQKKLEAIELVMETIEAMAAERGSEDKIWGSMVKQALKRRRPGFNENYYGFSSFSRLLDEAEARKLLTLEHDEKSGGVIIRGFSADW